MTSTTSTQTQLWNEIGDEIILGATDFTENERIIIKPDDNGNILSVETKEKENEDKTVTEYKEATVPIEFRGINARLRLNQKALKSLFFICQADESKLKNTEWAVTKVGSGTYQSYALTYIGKKGK